MPTPRKEATVAELKGLLAQSKLLILTDYRGLTVAEMGALRRQLRERGVEFHVAKNTLTIIAARESNLAQLEDLLQGPTAIVFAGGDVVGAAKQVMDFARTNKTIVVKGGLLDGQAIARAQVEALATLPPREVLVARLLGQMQAPMSNLVGVLQANLTGLLYALKARQEQLEAAA